MSDGAPLFRDESVRRVGTQAPDQTSADALLFRGDELLLELRPPHATSYAGQWDTPGGRVEAGETTDAALVREMREELGIELLEALLVAVVDHRDDGSGKLCRHFCYLLLRWSGEPRAAEGQHLEWKRADRLRAQARGESGERLAQLVPELVDLLRTQGRLPRR